MNEAKMNMKLKENEIAAIKCNAHLNSHEIRTTIDLPNLEGDIKIYLGQTIVSLI